MTQPFHSLGCFQPLRAFRLTMLSVLGALSPYQPYSHLKGNAKARSS